MSTSRLPVRALAAACGALAFTATPTDAFDHARPILNPLPVGGVTLDELIDQVRREATHRRETGESVTPARRLRLSEHGRAIVPANAPTAVKRLIRAGNRIAHKPYVWGGGHGSWIAEGYDCSGSLGYALHAAGVLDTAVTSGALASYGKAGRGRWVTIYANGGHTYMVVAGLRFDTTAFKQTGSRWARDGRNDGGYTVRHPAGM